MWRAFKYLQHLFYQRHRKGYGIHSPYLFELLHEVVYNASRIGVPLEIRTIHRELRKDRTLIGDPVPVPGASTLAAAAAEAADPDTAHPGSADGGNIAFGAGSRVDQAASRTVRSFVTRSSVSPRYGALLYRVSRWFEPEIVLELGTGLGISTLYLAGAAPGVPLHTIEGNDARADFSSHLFKRCGLSAVQVHAGEMEEMLERVSGIAGKRFLAFVDGNHRYEPTLRYIRWILSRAGEEAVIVVDDIYWSKGMQQAWKEIIRWPEVRVSIDLFHMGILLFRKDLAKTTLKMKF